jgi:hypothetical protein
MPGPLLTTRAGRLASSALALALAACLGGPAPTASAAVRTKQAKVGDAWVRTDLLRVTVNNGEHRITARAEVDRLPRRGYLWLTFWHHRDGGNLFVRPSDDGARVKIYRTRNLRDTRVTCAHSNGAWDREHDVVRVHFLRGCLRHQDRDDFTFGFHIYDYVGGGLIPYDSSDKVDVRSVDKG